MPITPAISIENYGPMKDQDWTTLPIKLPQQAYEGLCNLNEILDDLSQNRGQARLGDEEG
ncbi:MAG: hypothetical protein CMJ78_26150 [Planctomycetaceae bacterium]|nr:hypothetical protein [Planctomycetaceae bacterium]